MQPVLREYLVRIELCCEYFLYSQPFSFKIDIMLQLSMTFSYEIVVEQVSGRDHVLNHLSIPAACFTHPEISMVGLTEVKLL